jgi:hypothetical protein
MMSYQYYVCESETGVIVFLHFISAWIIVLSIFLYNLIIIACNHVGHGLPQFLVRMFTVFMRFYILWILNCFCKKICTCSMPWIDSCSIFYPLVGLSCIDIPVSWILWCPGLCCQQNCWWMRACTSWLPQCLGICSQHFYWITLGGTSLQILSETFIRSIPSTSSIHSGFTSMVCADASIIAITQSPSFLHFPQHEAKSWQNSYLSVILMCFFWQYILQNWWCVLSPFDLAVYVM